MTGTAPSQIGVQATAVISGSFLSGAMMGISIIAVPVVLDTNTQTSLLLDQYVRLYHYGHQIMPSLAIATFGLYGYTSFQKRAAGRPWLKHLLAGITTLALVPFTWVFMTPTNYKLFGLAGESKLASSSVTLEHAQSLLIWWAGLHVLRSLFPLAGAVLGGSHVLRELGYGK